MWSLIAGAGSGIGKALARQLAGPGGDLVLVARSTTQLDAVAADIRSRHPDCRVHLRAVDLARLDQVEALARELARMTASIGRLIYCAGEGEPASGLSHWDVADLNRALTVNVAAPLALIQGLMPRLNASEPAARIVMLGAGMDERVQPGTGSYGISKMALRRLVRQLAVEFDASEHAPVISLFQPGLVDTRGLRAHVEKAAKHGLPHADWVQNRLDSGQCLTAEQAAAALAFTLSDVPESDFHGAVFHGRELADSPSFAAS